MGEFGDKQDGVPAFSGTPFRVREGYVTLRWYRTGRPHPPAKGYQASGL